MILDLMNYDNVKKSFEIGNIEDINIITIDIISGDEIATIHYLDGNTETLYTDYAIMNFYDGSYDIYNANLENQYNLLFNERWLNRISSYDGLRCDE